MIDFKAILTCFISKYLYLKIGTYWSLAGTARTGSKNRDCPRKIGTLGRPDFRGWGSVTLKNRVGETVKRAHSPRKQGR